MWPLDHQSLRNAADKGASTVGCGRGRKKGGRTPAQSLLPGGSACTGPAPVCTSPRLTPRAAHGSRVRTRSGVMHVALGRGARGVQGDTSRAADCADPPAKSAQAPSATTTAGKSHSVVANSGSTPKGNLQCRNMIRAEGRAESRLGGSQFIAEAHAQSSAANAAAAHGGCHLAARQLQRPSDDVGG